MKKAIFLTNLFLIFIIIACSSTENSTPTLVSTNQPAPTLKPTATSTAIPTFTPTPIGGRDGLLLSFNGSTLWESGVGFRNDLDLVYIYDISFHTNKLLLEGYSCIGVSPDGTKIALRKTQEGKTDLFVMDLSKPDEIVLLYENVVNTNPLSDYSYWFPNSDWIGFIALKDGIKQIFIIHPDGSDLTQVTNSTIGVVRIEPVFHDGIYWAEGKENSRGSANIQNYKWTKLDGTEMTIRNFLTVSPNGKYISRSLKPQNPDCPFCDYILGDPITGEIEEVTLVKPRPDNEYPEIQPLSDDKWLVQWRNENQENLREGSTLAEYYASIEYWIYSPDGKPLFAFADLPHDHTQLPDNETDSVDSYNLIFTNSSNVPVMSLSPDGNLLLLKHEIRTYLEGNYVDKQDISYYLFDISTFEVQQVPNLIFDRHNTLGPNQGFFWIQSP